MGLPTCRYRRACFHDLIQIRRTSLRRHRYLTGIKKSGDVVVFDEEPAPCWTPCKGDSHE